MLRFRGWGSTEVFVEKRVDGLFEGSKNPSLTLRVSFVFHDFELVDGGEA